MGVRLLLWIVWGAKVTAQELWINLSFTKALMPSVLRVIPRYCVLRAYRITKWWTVLVYGAKQISLMCRGLSFILSFISLASSIWSVQKRQILQKAKNRSMHCPRWWVRPRSLSHSCKYSVPCNWPWPFHGWTPLHRWCISFRLFLLTSRTYLHF